MPNLNKGSKVRKRTNPQARRKRLRLVVALIFAALFAWIVWDVYNSSLFEIRKISVEGNREVKKGDILRRAGVRPGMSLVRISAGEIRDLIEKEPWIRDVRVVKEYPDKLRLIVSERKPLVSLRVGSAVFIVDKDGYVWKNSGKDRVLPEIRDLPVLKVEIGKRLKAKELKNALLCVGSMDRNIYELVVSLSAASVEGLTLQLSNGVLVSYGKATKTAKKNYVLGLILSQAHLKGEKLQRIDVRIASHPVINR